MKTTRYQTIRKVLVAFPIYLLTFLPFYFFTFMPLSLSAQDYTQRLQQSGTGQGTVTIHQSADIDYLVNNATLAPRPAPTAKGSNGQNSQPSQPNQPNQTSKSTADDSADSPTASEAPVDNTKKMIRGGVKVHGYRVQAYAGGNSRKDRQQAEQIGNNIKAAYPDVPVYVHFYSPRWICRVGNYRSYEEAHQMLLSLRKMGFSQATIVKGKITVSSY